MDKVLNKESRLCKFLLGTGQNRKVTEMAKKKRELTEQELRQKEMQELIELKKMRQAAKEGRELDESEGLHFEQEEVLVPKTFKEKWKNYWYHYKFQTWLTVFVAVLAVWFVKDVFFGAKPDLSIGIITYSGVSYFTDAIDEDLAAYAQDYNEDGEIYISASESYLDVEDVEMQAAYYQKFMAELAAGSELVYVLDDYTYDLILENTGNSMFIDFGELYPDVDFIEADKIDITDLPLGRKWHLPTLGTTEMDGYGDRRYYVCVRYLGNSAKDDEEHREELERGLDFVNNLIAESYPEYTDNQPYYDVEYDVLHKNGE